MKKKHLFEKGKSLDLLKGKSKSFGFSNENEETKDFICSPKNDESIENIMEKCLINVNITKEILNLTVKKSSKHIEEILDSFDNYNGWVKVQKYAHLNTPLTFYYKYFYFIFLGMKTILDTLQR